MKIISFILNLPYTITGLILGILSAPAKFNWNKKPYAIIIYVKNFWWAFGYMKNMRAATIGHIVLLGSKTMAGDLEHELVHVVQYQRNPILQPVFYYLELFRNGYKGNKYEIEAYKIAGNFYDEGVKK